VVGGDDPRGTHPTARLCGTPFGSCSLTAPYETPSTPSSPNTARGAGEEEPESAMQALTEQYSQQDVQAQAAASRQAAVAQRIQELKDELLENPLSQYYYSALAGILLDDEPRRACFLSSSSPKARSGEFSVTTSCPT